MKQAKLGWKMLVVAAVAVGVMGVWTQTDFDSLVIDRDWARDLKEISNIHNGDMVWLGPWLDPGLHASSSYYYFFYPAVAAGRGDPRAMVGWSVVLFAGVIGWWGWRWTREVGWIAAAGVAALGVSPWLLESVIHPGNGYSYTVLVLLALGLMYWRRSLVESSFMAGLATSFHPAAIVLVPLLLLESWRERRRKWVWLVGAVAFLLPWLPLVGFEVITKGFVLRQFLANPSSGALSWGIGGNSWEFIARALGLPVWGVFGAYLAGVVGSWKGEKRLRLWLGWWGVVWLATGLVSGVLHRYLFGVAVGVQVTLLLALSQVRWGRWLVLGYALWVTVQFASANVPEQATGGHTVGRMVALAQEFETEYGRLRGEKLAMMAAIEDKLMPQADDYRAYLRFKGFEVVDVTRNGEATYLVMFVEEQGFDWRRWANWEIGQFGEKELVATYESKAGEIVVYRKAE